LEDKRLPKLAKIKSKLLPREELGKAERRLAMRAELERLVPTYLAQGGSITQCPDEKTTRMLNKRPVGRPPIGERAMTVAEKKRRSRLRGPRENLLQILWKRIAVLHDEELKRRHHKLRVIVATPPLSPGDDINVRTINKPTRQHPGCLDQGRDNYADPETA
jgi:hypothetical protein